MSIALSLRDRFALVARAVRGTFPTDPNSIGGKILSGVVQSGGNPPARGTREQIAAYKTMPWLRAVVGRISYDVGSVRWELYTREKRGRPARDWEVQRAAFEERQQTIKSLVETGEMRRIDKHPALDLLHRANAFHTGLEMRRLTQQHLDLSGEAFWLLERTALGTPEGAWPIPPDWILATPTIKRPVFRVAFRGWQGEIPATEIVWFCDRDPSNPYGRGTGTGQALADELETDEYAAKHAKSFYHNRARPDLIVSPKGEEGMTEDEVRRLEEGWTRASGGFWRAFKPFFLRRGVDIKEVDQNFRSQMFVQLREFERNTILQVFGVSPEILGIVAGGSNRATISVAEFIYSRRVLVPRLELIRSVIQERVLPEFDERLVLDYVSPVARDAELELAAGKTAPWALTTNEWRERIGEEPLPNEDGDWFMVPAGYLPADYNGSGRAPKLPVTNNRPGESGQPGQNPESEVANSRQLVTEYAGEGWEDRPLKR